MLTREKLNITAIVTMAVMSVVFVLDGCCTKRQLDELQEEIRRVETQNAATRDLLVKLDSALTAGAAADNKLRADVTFTVNDLQQRIDMLLENYNDMLTQLQQLSRQSTVTHVIRSSPGAQEQTSATIVDTSARVEQPLAPGFDCTFAYDESFLLARQGEYERAIESFNRYLTNCPNHESIDFAYYWLGECYYAQEKYIDAIDWFERLLEKYKTSTKASSALYKVGRSQQELGKINDAKATYQRVIDDYPGSLEESQARERLKDLK